MIVDSTALPEQAVRDILASAFQSAGQRCSALRVLYLQEDVAESFLEMLTGAMDELSVGDPWALSTDVGPVIDDAAKAKIMEHVGQAFRDGRMVKQLAFPQTGTYVPPTLIKIDSILDLEEEIFGPVLHVAMFAADEIDQVIDDINATGYGLTFGVHTRIDDRVQHLVDRVKAGNIYVNRNQIGAIVGSQPFGGEGLSGTGPKAGGPHYVPRFTKPKYRNGSHDTVTQKTPLVEMANVQKAISKARSNYTETLIDTLDLPGPTGESNRMSSVSRGVFLCLGPGPDLANAQAAAAKDNGCGAVRITPGTGMDVEGYLEPGLLHALEGFDGVCWSGDVETGRALRKTLSSREGAILPLVTDIKNSASFCSERHVCVDTTASGGNAALLAAQ